MDPEEKDSGEQASFEHHATRQRRTAYGPATRTTVGEHPDDVAVTFTADIEEDR